MKRFIWVIIGVTLLGGGASAAMADHGRGYGYGHSHHHHARGGYGYGYGYGVNPYRYGSFYRGPVWHDTTHFDYHGPSLQYHRGHYDYVPGHLDLHRSGHWDW